LLRGAVKDPFARYELARGEQRVRELEIRLEQAVTALEAAGLSRGTTLGTPPMGPHMRWLDRQGVGGGDWLYASMQKSTGEWKWFLILKAT
jgi:hypothetical protein